MMFYLQNVLSVAKVFILFIISTVSEWKMVSSQKLIICVIKEDVDNKLL